MNDYENRIKVLSRSLRSELADHSQLIELILNALSTKSGDISDDNQGRVFIDTFIFDEETQEIIFTTRGGAGYGVAKYISLQYKDKRVRLEWLSEGFIDFGKIIYKNGQYEE